MKNGMDRLQDKWVKNTLAAPQGGSLKVVAVLFGPLVPVRIPEVFNRLPHNPALFSFCVVAWLFSLLVCNRNGRIPAVAVSRRPTRTVRRDVLPGGPDKRIVVTCSL